MLLSSFHGTRKYINYHRDGNSTGNGIVPSLEKTKAKMSSRAPLSVSRAVKKKVVEVKKAEEKRLPLGVNLEDPLTKKAITTYIPIVICLLILMFLDAAYSGDWSRIGVLTSEQEKLLRDFVVLSVAIHGLLGLGAAVVSYRRGEKSFLVRGLKTFVVGIVAFSEVWYIPEE